MYLELGSKTDAKYYNGMVSGHYSLARYFKSLIGRDMLVNTRSKVDPSLSPEELKLDGLPLMDSLTC